jgi:hypothetical protein
MARKSKTAEFVARLRSNVDALYAREIDQTEFTRRQRKTWDAVRSAGTRVETNVCRSLVG